MKYFSEPTSHVLLSPYAACCNTIFFLSFSDLYLLQQLFSKVVRHVNHLQWVGAHNFFIWFLKVYCILTENVILGYHCFCEKSIELNLNQTAYAFTEIAPSFSMCHKQSAREKQEENGMVQFYPTILSAAWLPSQFSYEGLIWRTHIYIWVLLTLFLTHFLTEAIFLLLLHSP